MSPGAVLWVDNIQNGLRRVSSREIGPAGLLDGQAKGIGLSLFSPLGVYVLSCSNVWKGLLECSNCYPAGDSQPVR